MHRTETENCVSIHDYYPGKLVLSDWPLVDSGSVCHSGIAAVRSKAAPRWRFPWQPNAQPCSWRRGGGRWRGRRGWESVWGAEREKGITWQTLLYHSNLYTLYITILTLDYQWRGEWAPNWSAVQPDSLKSPVRNKRHEDETRMKLLLYSTLPHQVWWCCRFL